jgi:hypothetical protein
MHQFDFAEIKVTHAKLPITLAGATDQGVLWQATSERFMLEVPFVARYLVEEGQSITIDQVPEASPQAVRRHLKMLPLAALLYQRGMLAFHAAVVANDQGAVLLAGDSGSGKSVLLTALVKRGWSMMADDLAIVGLDKLGQPVIYPTAQGIALWPESLKKLGVDPASLPLVDANRRELFSAGQFTKAPQPLRAIYSLSIQSKSEVEFDKIDIKANFRSVGTLLYNSHVADAVCSRADYLRSVAAIAQQVPIRILRRPREIWSLETLIEFISI